MESGGRAASSDDEDVRSPGPAAVPAPAAAPPASTRPYYECVFCKRGFTAAQALGGHMNIHRRDRAKHARVGAPTAGAITSSVSRSTAECFGQHRHLSYSQVWPSMPPMSRGMLCYYPGAAAAVPGVDGEPLMSPSPVELSLFNADTTDLDHDHDHDLHLGLGCYGRAGEGSERQADGEPERTKLDLELRLGRVVPGID